MTPVIIAQIHAAVNLTDMDEKKRFTGASHDVTLLNVDCALVSFAFKVT